ncbi:MAG: hypothetical protein IJB93_07430 [Clostridia bacterium]|nr:hypothetical protein [Clostridia bacterium]
MKKFASISILIFIALIFSLCIFAICNDGVESQRHNNEAISDQKNFQGFSDLGDHFDTIIKVQDIGLNLVYGSGTVTVKNSNSEGYYFENSYASTIHIWSNWSWLDQNWDETKEIYTIDTDYNYVFSYNIIDNDNLLIGEGLDSEKLTIEIIMETDREDVFIITVTRDCYGVENDESGLSYMATNFNTLTELDTEEFGEPVYSNDGDIFYGYEKRRIYF